MVAMRDRQPPGQAPLHSAAPSSRRRGPSRALLAMLPLVAAPLLGVGLAQPLRPDPASLPSLPPARFDASLD